MISSHQQVNTIANSAFQIVPRHSIIRFQVADNGLNRRTSSALFSFLVFLVSGIFLEPFSGQNDLGSIDFTFAAVAAIAYGLLGCFPARDLNMAQYFRQSMTVMQVLFVTDNPDNQITFRGTGYRCLTAVFVLFVVFPLTNTVHLWFVQ